MNDNSISYERNMADPAYCEWIFLDGQYIGEDYLFCRRAREEGFTVFLDPMISLPHIGTQEFARNFNEDVLKPVLAENARQLKKVA